KFTGVGTQLVDVVAQVVAQVLCAHGDQRVHSATRSPLRFWNCSCSARIAFTTSPSTSSRCIITSADDVLKERWARACQRSCSISSEQVSQAAQSPSLAQGTSSALPFLVTKTAVIPKLVQG